MVGEVMTIKILGSTRTVRVDDFAMVNERAFKNHTQSLQALNERGGVTWCEALALLEDREWVSMAEVRAIARIEELVK